MQREAAEDMTQETLLILHEKYPHVASIDELVPLAFQVLRFKMAAFLRKSVRRGEDRALLVDDLPLADPGGTPEDQALRHERRALMIRAIDELGERCREILRMKLAGRSFDDIRTHFGVDSINTIYTWDLRCRRQMIEKLRGLFEPGSAVKGKEAGHDAR
jgi:RNA polymerase sigma-70 factor (ECF subfamily)